MFQSAILGHHFKQKFDFLIQAVEDMMTTASISASLRDDLKIFFEQNPSVDVVTAYLFYLERKYDIHPVLFIKEKTIYKNEESLVKKLEEQGKLWRETEIKIQVGQPCVNGETKKIYICPFTGKVFGDNTHPNPQDAIYDWVSKCPENTERQNGLKVKRFFVSEDPEVIKNYIEKRREPIKKIVFSSAVSGKLFNSKKSVIADFKKTHLKALSLIEVSNQNRFGLEDGLLLFIQEHMDEGKVASFAEAISNEKTLSEYASEWLEEE